MRDALTPDSKSFTSNAALARAVGVHRDQVRLWRLHEQAPQDLSLATWRRWLVETGRTRYAETIPSVLAGGNDPPAADECPRQGTLSDLADVVEGDEGHWKARTARARAILAERELAEDEGRLVERDQFTAAVRKLGASVLAALLASKPWDAINPTLDGLSPAQRQAIQVAFERWIMELRARLAILPASVSDDVLARPESKR